MYNDRAQFQQKDLEEDSKMLPTKEVAKRVGYTPDYVARLAREGKVIAKQEGRQWLVSPDSVKLFALEAEAEKRERQKELREERMRERQRSKVQTQTVAVVSRVDQTAPAALLQTVAVFACAVLFGSLLWTTQSQALNLQAFAFGAGAISDQIVSLFDLSGWFDGAPESDISTPTSAQPAFGIGVLPGDATEAEMQAVKDSFSDEVSVEFADNRTGVITPVFKHATGTESYRFLLVPIVEAGRN